MDAISLFAGLLALALGAVLGYLVAMRRVAGQAAELAGEARAARERAALVDGHVAERYQVLSDLDARRAAVEQLVEPLRDTLARVETQLRAADEARTLSHAALAEQVQIARRGTEQLRDQTQALVTALRRPEARGRWGEMQLRRVAELAGMSARCDFDEQVTVTGADGTIRPDMVIRLAGGKNIVVDSKVSLAAYLEAAQAPDEALRANRLDAHARHLRQHVDQLAAKSYWAALSPAPEFVVLFIPGEAFLAPALEHDPGLLEHAMARRVHIATPTTLITMLRTAQYAWQQETLSQHARAVFDLGRDLYGSLSVLGQHVDGLGKALGTAVTAYNRAVGSLESRVLAKARKLSDLGVTSEGLDSPRPVEDTVRALAAPDLTMPDLIAGPELVQGG